MSGLGWKNPVKVDGFDNSKRAKQGLGRGINQRKNIFKKKRQGMQTFAYLLHQPHVSKGRIFAFFSSKQKL